MPLEATVAAPEGRFAAGKTRRAVTAVADAAAVMAATAAPGHSDVTGTVAPETIAAQILDCSLPGETSLIGPVTAP